MVMGDDHQERKFVCKWCNKCYPCGKSLGGHIKSHKRPKPVENVSSFDNAGGGVSRSCNVESSQVEIVGGNSSYRLRENRRMSFKAVESIDDDGFPLFREEHVCQHCGKGFQSVKALSRHMASHSEKGDRGFKDDYSWKKIEMDSSSDTVSEEIKAKNKRPNVVLKSSTLCLGNNNGSSSSVSEIDELDEKEVANWLMMLSRDSRSWHGVTSVVESSDNQSDVLETNKSSSFETKIRRNPVFLQDDDVTKVDSKAAAAAEVFEPESSDSGYYLDECVEKGESDTSFEGFFKNVTAVYEAKNKWPNVVEPKSKKRPYQPKEKVLSKPAAKRSKYECTNCKKTFNSYQGLGGHRPCNKKPNLYEENREASLDQDATEEYSEDESNTKIREFSSSKKKVFEKKLSSASASKKDKDKDKIHECPFCNRIFKNGQALGGHKRSHFLFGNTSGGGGGGRLVQQQQQQTEHTDDLLDLNFPAPTEEEEDESDDDDDDDGDCIRDRRFLASIDE